MWKKLGTGGRIIMLTALTALVVTTATLVTLFLTQTNSQRTTRLYDTQIICKQASSIAENACSYIRGAADFFGINPDIAYILQHEEWDPQASEIATKMFSIFQTDNYILNIVLYNTKGIPMQYMAIDSSHTPLPQGDTEEFQQLLRDPSVKYRWEYIDAHSNRLFLHDNSPKLCLWHTIQSSNNRTVYGAIAVSIDVRNLLSFEVPYTTQYRRMFSIYDRAHDQIILDNFSGETDVQHLLHNAIGSNENGYFSIDHPNLIVLYDSIFDTGLYVIYSVEIESPMKSTDIGMLIISGLLTFCIIIFPLGFYINRNLTLPLQRLRSKIDQFSSGNSPARIEDIHDDDIGLVEHAFNNMVAENKRLIDENVFSLLKLKESQLNLLQSNINPHFLYNTINSIQWEASRVGNEQAAKMAHSLGQLMRITLSHGSFYISVRQECDLVEHYLSLQKYRYGSRLVYSIECAAEAQNVCVPKLILQPIVENSIVHGLDENGDILQINLRVYLEEGMLVIIIEDDGPGIAPEILKTLPNIPDSNRASGNGYAIRNIYDRLCLVYKSGNFTFEFSSQEGCGTFVTFKLPLEIPNKRG